MTEVANGTPPLAPNGPSSISVTNGVNGTDHSDGTNGVDQAAKFLDGLIYPPPDIRSIIDKTAALIAKHPNPQSIETKIQGRAATDTRFAFANTNDAYHAYYQHQIQEYKETGGPTTDGQLTDVKIDEATKEKDEDEGKPKGARPPEYEFLAETPAANSVDLDIVRLTALFAARSGRKFIDDIRQREARNFQFDFLKAGHTLFGYFNRLVDMYTKVLLVSERGDDGEEGPLRRLERRAGLLSLDDKVKPENKSEADLELERKARGKREVLKDVEKRVEWQKWELSKRKQQEDFEEAERRAFNEIDWQDFVVVSTVEFTEADQEMDLPPPMSLREVQAMTLREKKMAQLIMEGREEEMVEQELGFDRNATVEEVADKDAMAEEEAERERKKVVEIKVADTGAPMKIRQDYVPKSKQQKQVPMTLCNVCGQHVPTAEFQEHIRIELISPQYRDQRLAADRNRGVGVPMPAGDMSTALRNLTRERPDIFGASITEEEERKRAEEERQRAKEREKSVWDGHAASSRSVTDKFQSNVNFDDQIAALHRSKGLVADESNIGPQIGPAVGPMPPPVEQNPPPMPMGMPENPQFTGATMIAGPQPNQMNPMFGAPPGMMPPMGFAPPPFSGPPMMPPMGPAGMSMPPPMPGMPMHPGMSMPPGPPAAPAAMVSHPSLPSRPPVPEPGSGLPGQAPSTFVPGPSPYGNQQPQMNTRTAEEPPEGEPAAKRMKVPKLPDGQYYPEEDWLRMHPEPIKLIIQLPSYPDKPEWGCDGSQLTLEDVELTRFVGTLRERVQARIGLPIGKQKLTFGSRPLGFQTTLASLNFQDGDVITLSIKDPKKK